MNKMMKSILLSIVSAFCCLAGYAGNPTIIFQTSRATGIPATLKVRLAEPGKINVDWGDGTIREYAVGTESSIVEGPIAGKVVKIYGSGVIFFDCTDNDIIDLDVATATELQQLYCGKNLLEAIDVSANRELVRLGCNNNRIPTLSLRNNSKLTGLYLQDNRMNATSLNAIFGELPRRPRTPDHITLRLKGNPGATVCNTKLAVSKNWMPDIEGSNTGGQPIVLTTSKETGTQIVLEMRLTEPGTIEIDWGKGPQKAVVGNKSTRISGTLSGNEIRIYGDQINFLKCERMGLTSIDVSKATQLQQLYCGYNELISLDVTNNKGLMRLGCNNNALTELDLSSNGKLSGMYFQNNRFDTKALNRIFNQLPTRSKRSKNVNFRITGNPGAEKCRIAVAEQKNWYVDISNKQ